MTAVVTSGSPDTSTRIGGDTVWVDVVEGQLKTRVFATDRVSDRPILILVLHGDIPNPKLDYHYLFAKAITIGFPEDSERSAVLRSVLGQNWKAERVVAAGILRPGYADFSGDRSSGDMGMAYGDNYTPEVVDAVASATRYLKEKYNAHTVILVGHSGGGAITANLLGRHPDLVDGALLVGCGCDPEAWRSRMRAQDSRPFWDEPNPSIMPLSMTEKVRQGTLVRLIVGADDDVAIPDYSRRYTDALQRRGIDARLKIVPGLGHNILITPETFRELGSLVQELSSDGG
ncbi:MAG: alpha/beta fold hydrolase [Gammaproteobacteria bacterium]|nr:alpha/beta fold hydrolase [Gammaproteobacteria bacterium]